MILYVERLYLLLTASLTTSLLLTPNLWLPERGFPLAPVVSLPPFVPNDQVLLPICLLSLVLSTITRWRRLFFTAAAITFVGMIIRDQGRLQPYLYLYLSLLAILTFSQRDRAGGALLVALSALYIWSGIHKINVHFVFEVFPWLVSAITEKQVAQKVALTIPFIEIGAGALLLVEELRRAGAIALSFMHLILLLLIGPLGHSWNSSVWLWNLTMPLVCCLLAYDSFRFTPKLSYCTHPLLALFVLAPSLNLVGLFDHYPAFSLYSGLTPKGWIVASGARVSIQEWSLGTTGVPPYPEVRVYKAIAAELCEKGETTLEIQEPRGRLLPGVTVSTYSCSDLRREWG